MTDWMNVNEVWIFLQNIMNNNNGNDKNEIETESTRRCKHFIDIIFRLDDSTVQD